MSIIVRSDNDVSAMLSHVDSMPWSVVIPVFQEPNVHPFQNSILMLVVCTEQEEYLVPLNTYDVKPVGDDIVDLLCLRSTVLWHRARQTFQALNRADIPKSVLDVDILRWFYGYPVHVHKYEPSPFSKYARMKSLDGFSNSVIPSSVIASSAIEFVQSKLVPDTPFERMSDENYLKFNEVSIRAWDFIERNGLYTTNGMEYTQYHPYSVTGRPSNTWGGVNYAALNKHDGSRARVVSRYGNDGVLVQFDYNAYHVRLIASVCGYHIPSDVNVHEHLGKMYFGKDSLTEDEYEQSKAITFKILYGGVPDEYKNLDFFQQVSSLIDAQWSEYVETGIAKSFVYGSEFRREHLPEMNRLKLFNYLLQNFETEYNLDRINMIREAMADEDSPLVLYTYDSFLFDVMKSDVQNFIKTMKQLFEVHGDISVTVSVGNNYDEMKIVG